MIKAVLFDLDGTLVNSLEDLANCTNDALTEFGFPKRETEEFKYFAGNGMPVMIERALPNGNKTEENINKVLKAFLKNYGEHFADNTYAYKGVPELVAELKDRGIKAAVITNKAQKSAECVVKKNYGDLFDIIMGKTEKYPSKPSPDGALAVMKDFRVLPQECIFIGDSLVDMQTAVNSKALPVGVLWGFRTAGELRDNGAEYIISEPKELLKILEEKNGI